ncbi:hypothetical protein ACNKHM_15365 [Shigella sonnei]
MKPGEGGQLARSAGTFVRIVAREGTYVTASAFGEVRKVVADCRATLVKSVMRAHVACLIKQGAARWRGIRRPFAVWR